MKRTSAVSVAFVALAMVGCADNGNGVAAESPAAQTSPTTGSVPPILAEVDPCSLIRQDEVDDSTGIRGLRPERGRATPEFPATDGCDWGPPGGGSDPGSIGVATSIAESREQMTDERSVLMAQRLGRRALVYSSSPTVCMAYAEYSENRVVTVLIRPSDEKLAAHPPVRDVDTVCDRSMDLMATIFQRVPWE